MWDFFLRLTNWSMIPEMNNIFQGIIHEIIPYISSKERIAFFNLGEINNCSKNNLTEAIKLKNVLLYITKNIITLIVLI